MNFKAFLIEQEEKVVYILRGISGSGKSTLAQSLVGDGVIYGADDFFMQDGKYTFDPTRLPEIHQANQARTEKAMQQGISPIVVDNTNTKAYEIKPYVQLAQKHGYQVEFKEIPPDRFSAEELERRNNNRPPEQQRGITKDRIQDMIDGWDHDMTSDKALASKAPWEH